MARRNNGRFRREQRKEDAEARNGLRSSRTNAEQLKKLEGYEAKKERARLQKKIEKMES